MQDLEKEHRNDISTLTMLRTHPRHIHVTLSSALTIDDLAMTLMKNNSLALLNSLYSM